jgi:hypothetical protein
MDKAAKKGEAEKSNPIVPTRTVTRDVYYLEILPSSSHRDGSVYKRGLHWTTDYYRNIIANRKESK